MENTQTKSNRKLLVIVGVLVVLGVVAAVAIYALVGSNTKTQPTSSTASQQPFPRVATKDQVKQNLNDLKSSLKQAASDQAAAKSTLQESQNQVKVGN